MPIAASSCPIPSPVRSQTCRPPRVPRGPVGPRTQEAPPAPIRASAHCPPHPSQERIARPPSAPRLPSGEPSTRTRPPGIPGGFKRGSVSCWPALGAGSWAAFESLPPKSSFSAGLSPLPQPRSLRTSGSFQKQRPDSPRDPRYVGKAFRSGGKAAGSEGSGACGRQQPSEKLVCTCELGPVPRPRRLWVLVQVRANRGWAGVLSALAFGVPGGRR